MKRDEVILVRGGGDLATGTIHRLWSAGLKVLVLEAEQPPPIRRQVSVSEAVYQGEAVVEGMRATLVQTLDEAVVVWCRGDVPVMVDPKGALIPQVRPAVVVDAILAKKNLGTTRDMAPLTIALGPGFTAGEDVDFVVETSAAIVWDASSGRASPSRTPASPASSAATAQSGSSAQRGKASSMSCAPIGDVVESGDVIAEIEAFDGTRTPVTTCIGGILRGLLRDGYPVTMGFKVADVDPRREELENCFLISDKARCIAGSVLELVAEQLWK